MMLAYFSSFLMRFLVLLVTRVVSTGTAEVMMHVVTKDMRNFGYVEEDAGYNYNS